MQNKIRCGWVTNDPIDINYHDHEWGKPIYNDQLLFEFLILEGAQAGLSWLTILKKRENYRAFFDNFDPKIIARYDKHKVDELLNNSGIIRNRLKIESTIINAKAYLKIIKEFNSFSAYIWHFVNNQPIKNNWENSTLIPSQTILSDKISKDLKKRGFKFVGSTICYAFMQAVGIVNDHTKNCFCYNS